MRRLLSVILVSCLLALLVFVGRENISPVKASQDIFQGDLVLAGNNVTIIEGRFDINGSILIEENATLILKNALLNFTSGSHSMNLQNPVNGNPRLMANNATIIGLSTSRYYGNGTLHLSNCSVYGPGGLFFYDESNVTVLDSNIEKNLQARDSSRVAISNSTIETLEIVTSSANSSIENLNAGFFNYWDFWLNCSVVVSPLGRAPNVTLDQTTILEWRFSFQDSSYSEIFSSEMWLLHANEDAHVTLYNSTMNTIELYWTSVVELVNSTYVLTDLSGESKVYVSWYLSVHVVDSILQDVPLANISVTFPNATLAGLKVSDVNGWATFTLLEKMMNATGNYPVGNYGVEATYGNHSDSTTVNLTENKEITLTLGDFIIPEFSTIVILPLFAITLLLAVLVTRRKRPK